MTTTNFVSPFPFSAVAAATLWLVGCATPMATPTATTTTLPTPKAAAAAPAPAAATAAAATPVVVANAAAAPASSASGPARASPPDPTAPKPFAEVAKDATRQDGFIPLWRKDEKVWLELTTEMFGKPFLLSVNVSSSIGERGLHASSMGPVWSVEFRRIGNQFQLIARNMAHRADRDPAMQRAVRDSFSDSLLASGTVASAAHPERKSVLLDASFLLGDLALYSTELEQAFRMPFAPDRANSFFESSRAEAGLTTLQGRVHYAVPRISAAPLLPPGAPAPLTPPPPQATPDPRSLFVGFTYNLRALPEQPMAPRLADQRVGYFVNNFVDYSDDLRLNSRVSYVKRWRLEKKDPAAALSEPVKPITYWLDKNIPQRYRASVQAGILEWNKAFERIGFKDAIVVQQQADDDSFNTMDAGHASIRWYTALDAGGAFGPSHADPRTGEILDADIGMTEGFARSARFVAAEGSLMPTFAQPAQAGRSLWSHAHDESCVYAHEASGQLGFALDLLEARGDVEPDSPEAEALAQAYVKDTITHEVGHTLGLRHNFKASTTITRQHLMDREQSRSKGISGSVMDYNHFNLPLKGEPKSEPNMVTLGAYDYWAIEYAYKPLDPANEKQELAAIAQRGSTDPALAFGDDGDVGGPWPGNEGLDPYINQFDMGDEPLDWVKRQLSLSKELWQRLQERAPKAGDDPLRTRRSLASSFRQIARLPEMAAKYVGGMHTNHDLPGTSTRASFKPVDPAKQRQALRYLNENIFSVDSFRFSPALLASMGPDHIEWVRAAPVNVALSVLQLQTPVLDRLMGAGTAQRLLRLPDYLSVPERKGAISVSEVYTTLQSAVWSELKTGRDIEPMRRSLQREHLKRVQALLTRPAANMPADAVSLARWHANELLVDLRKAVAKPGLSIENKAHLQDSVGLLTEALRATMQRG